MSHIVPLRSESDDPLSRMAAYRLARELLKECWPDCEKTKHDAATIKLSGQLYAAVGSIAANLAEGYSRSSGKDRARIFEYALGSVRESMTWYYAAEPVLGNNIVNERLDKLEQIQKAAPRHYSPRASPFGETGCNPVRFDLARCSH